MRTLSLTVIAALAATGCGGGHLPPPAPPPILTLAMNGVGNGTLTQADPRMRDSSAYELWRFTGKAGQLVQVDLEARQFEAYLQLRDSTGRELTHDDGRGGMARVIATLPGTGTYQVLVNGYGRYGQYSVSLKSLGMAIENSDSSAVLPDTKGVILPGQSITGRLSRDEPQLSDGSVYQAWTYVGHAGEIVQIDITSSEFDAFAILLDAGGRKLADDDDSGGGTNARILTTLPYTGAYRIIANSAKRDEYGAFTVRVTEK